MGSRQSRSKYVIVQAGPLHWIDKDRSFDPGVELDKSFADELDCPVADSLVMALRRTFSLTYPTKPFVEGMAEAITEIRRIGTEVLVEMPEVLGELALKPIPRPLVDSRTPKGELFLFYLAKTSDLRITVKHENRKRSLLNLIGHMPADVLIRTLRTVVSDSFTEMHDEYEHRAVLRSMRSKVWAVLPAYNEVLREIEAEPIAEIVAEESDEPTEDV